MTRGTKWIFAGVGVAVLAGAGVVLWRYPYFIDVVRGGTLDRQCSGRISISGDVDGESIGERHCLTGTGSVKEEYVGSDGRTYDRITLSTEYGSRGRLILSSHGARGKAPGGYALLRLPGAPERWFCAAEVKVRVTGGEGEGTLGSVAPLDVSTPDPTGGSLDWEDVGGSPSFESHFAGRELHESEFGGQDANPEHTRVDLRITLGPLMAAEQSLRIGMAADESMLDAPTGVRLVSVYVIAEDKAWATPRLSVASLASGSTASVGRSNGRSIHLQGLSEPTACPSEPHGTGKVSISWSR